MALEKKGDHWYGTTLKDLEQEIVRYSNKNGYTSRKFAIIHCECGSKLFGLETDEVEGAARRVCARCKKMSFIGDSEEFSLDANFEAHTCICEGDEFQIIAAVALYEASSDVQWLYIGCHCSTCKLVGVFADWKCEAGDATEFLSKV